MYEYVLKQISYPKSSRAIQRWTKSICQSVKALFMVLLDKMEPENQH